jgi:hypothetical protein
MQASVSQSMVGVNEKWQKLTFLSSLKYGNGYFVGFLFHDEEDQFSQVACL